MIDYTGKQLGNYRLLRSLGRGGFAEVYLGEHIHLGTLAAIKVLPDLIEGGGWDDFRIEAQIIAHLHHPHIVRVLDFGVENRLPFLVMDYVPNGTLRQRYPHGTVLPFPVIASYVKQIAQALQYAHDRKIIHRDVKPENMLLDINDQVLLSDFGISAVERSTSKLSTLRKDGSDQAGTPVYMAPEQIYGNPHPASDQYALAVVTYEWLCGARPFTGDLFAVLYQHVHAQPPSLREKLASVSPEIEQVVFRALAKDPQQRYPFVQDYAKAFEEAVQAEVGETFFRRPPPVPQPLPVAIPQFTPSPPLPAQAPVQLAPFRLPGSSATLKQTQLPLPESGQTVRRRKGPAPYWIASLIALAIILIAGSVALFLSLPKNGQATSPNVSLTATARAQIQASATARAQTQASATASAAVNVYNAAAANGVMNGYDAQHTRVNSYEKAISPTTVSQLRRAWKIPVSGTIESAATVAGGLVYISASGPGNNGAFYALDARTGTVKWQEPGIGSNDFGNAPAFTNSIVYIGGSDNCLYAFDASSGNIKWKICTSGRIGSSPTLANGVIYMGSDDHNLYAFNATTGQQLWLYTTGSDIRSSPAVYNGIVYVGSNDGNLYAIDATSGNKVWSYSTGNAILSTPAVANGIVYVGSEVDKLYALNAANGTLRWSVTTDGVVDSSPAVYNGVVYVGSQDGKLYAINAANGNILWTATTGDGIRSSPTIANGVLFIGSNDDHLYAYAAAGCSSSTCSPLWSASTGGEVVSSPVVANGYVYVGSNDAHVYAFDLGE
jgi:eukaryotic-like serine/threonine-protein kinase